MIRKTAIGSRLAFGKRRQGAHHVDALARLDLEDLRTEEGQGLADDGSRPDPAQVDDPYAFERSLRAHVDQMTALSRNDAIFAAGNENSSP